MNKFRLKWIKRKIGGTIWATLVNGFDCYRSSVQNSLLTTALPTFWDLKPCLSRSHSNSRIDLLRQQESRWIACPEVIFFFPRVWARGHVSPWQFSHKGLHDTVPDAASDSEVWDSQTANCTLLCPLSLADIAPVSDIDCSSSASPD